MMPKLHQGFLLFFQSNPYSKIRVSWCKKGVKAKSMAYIGAWGVLWPEKVENGLKLHSRKVNECLGTNGWVFRYYYTMGKKVQTYVWGLPSGLKTGLRAFVWSYSTCLHLVPSSCIVLPRVNQTEIHVIPIATVTPLPCQLRCHIIILPVWLWFDC